MNDVICIILVNYNGKAYNDKCITSILNSSIGERLYVVVVDNASKDGSLEELREKWGNHSQVHIIELDDNYGFSKANNEGIKWAILQGIEYFVLLNNDTEVIQSDWLDYMVGYASQEHIGCVGIKLLYPDNKVQHAGVALVKKILIERKIFFKVCNELSFYC